MTGIRFITVFLSLMLWAVSVCAAQTIDTSFIPRGVDLSVSDHLASLGTAEKCHNFNLGRTYGPMSPRGGFSYYSFRDSLWFLSGLFSCARKVGDKYYFITSDSIGDGATGYTTYGW